MNLAFLGERSIMKKAISLVGFSMCSYNHLRKDTIRD
jgi:hypothetical protein